MITTDPHSPDFLPAFCPNPNCAHHKQFPEHGGYKKIGFYTRQQAPERIQRFTCHRCGRSFSSQTFSTTYWQKLPHLELHLMTETNSCACGRQLSRDHTVAPETINRHQARLGRHCILFHAKMMQQSPPPREIAIDGFVTFEWSQYFPCHFHLAVEKGTDFLLYFTDSEVRRSGTMTRRQKQRRAELEQRFGRPDPLAVLKDVAEMATVSVGRQPGVTIYSDDHKAYPRALRSLPVAVEHRVTSSRAHRGNRNPLWEMNLADLLIRHSSANHKRETIAWAKRRQASAERMAIFLVWRNYMKGRREKERGSPTPAMARGMCDRPLTAADILRERIFPTRLELPPRWWRYYWREIETRALGRNRRHALKYAA